ncbi:MAG TPA: hypothetical protein VMH61_08705, partial [Candidatus Acidoferrales bacterium]|nr:hypothetical protein [Candidatus Acidoferrales bacterium]
DPGLPLYDEASHAWAGVEVADALRQFDAPALFLALDRQVVWPFVHSLLLAPAYLAAGERIDVARLVSVAAWAVAALLMFAAGRALHPARGAWIGLVAAALALLSPLHQAFATLAMLEAPGTLLLALALTLALRTLPGPGPRSPALAAAIAGAALFLCKTNYGLLWLVPLLIAEWGEARPEQRASLRASLAAWWARRGWLGPLPLAFALGAIVTFAVLVTGGGEARLLGRRLAFHSPGNLVTALGWLGVLVLAWRAQRDRAAVRRAWGALEPRQRALAAGFLAPIALWLLIPWPNRIRALVDFASNRDSGLPFWTAQGFAYAPRAFVTQCAPNLVAGIAVLGLALLPPPRAAKRSRLVWWAGLVALAATIVHRDRAPRFLATVAPLLWLAAADRAAALWAALVDRAAPRAPLVRSVGVPVALLAALALLVVVALRVPDLARVRADRSGYLLRPDVAPAVDRVLVLAHDVPQPAALLGFSNELSPGLLRWRALARGVSLAHFPRRPGPPTSRGASGAGRMGAFLLAALPESSLAASEPAWAAEVRADSGVAARLAADPAVATLCDETIAGVRVREFRLR